MEANNSNNHSFYGKISEEKPFADPTGSSIEDPLCKLNLKETSEFVKSFPVASNGNNAECRGLFQVSAERRREQRRVEAPSTPGRPVFSFSSNNLAKKSFPSKWDEAEKWLISSSTSCRESPAHSIKPSGLPQHSSKIDKVQCDEMRKQIEVFAEKSRVLVSSFHGSASLDQYDANNSSGVAASDLLLKGAYPTLSIVFLFSIPISCCSTSIILLMQKSHFIVFAKAKKRSPLIHSYCLNLLLESCY